MLTQEAKEIIITIHELEEELKYIYKVILIKNK